MLETPIAENPTMIVEGTTTMDTQGSFKRMEKKSEGV